METQSDLQGYGSTRLPYVDFLVGPRNVALEQERVQRREDEELAELVQEVEGPKPVTEAGDVVTAFLEDQPPNLRWRDTVLRTTACRLSAVADSLDAEARKQFLSEPTMSVLMAAAAPACGGLLSPPTVPAAAPACGGSEPVGGTKRQPADQRDIEVCGLCMIAVGSRTWMILVHPLKWNLLHHLHHSWKLPEPAGGEASAENQEPAGGGSEPACGLGPSRCSIGGSAVSLSPESPLPSISEDEQVGSPGQGCPRFDRFDFITSYRLRSIDLYD